MPDTPFEDHGGDETTTNRPTTITYEIDDDELPSEAVVLATSAYTNTPVIDLDPLYETVNPTHLDGLFDDSADRTIDEDSSVAFSYNGCHVSVSGGTVVVRSE